MVQAAPGADVIDPATPGGKYLFDQLVLAPFDNKKRVPEHVSLSFSSVVPPLWTEEKERQMQQPLPSLLAMTASGNSNSIMFNSRDYI